MHPSAAARLAKGKTKTWSSGALISEIDEGMIERGWEWFDSLLKTNKDFATGSFFLVETMQEVSHPRIQRMETHIE